MSLNIKSILVFLEELPEKLEAFIDSPHVESEFSALSSELTTLLPLAIQAVQFVESKAPNRTVAEVGSVLTEVGVLATIDPSTPPNDPTIKGLLLQAAEAALRGNLSLAIQKAGFAGFTYGTTEITNVSGISAATLDAAVQLAFTFLHRVAETTLVTTSSPAPDAVAKEKD